MELKFKVRSIVPDQAEYRIFKETETPVADGIRVDATVAEDE